MWRASIFAYLMFAALPSYAQQCQHVSDIKSSRPVELSGELQEKWFWGPPNFGENPKTDAHYKVLVLNLDGPLRLKGFSDQDPTHSLKNIQVGISSENPPKQSIRDFIGQHILVSGTLKAWLLPSDHTPAVLDASNIEVSKAKTAQLCVEYDSN